MKGSGIIYVNIKTYGNFYHVYRDDCYILYFLFGYKIKNNRVGFPKSVINKVENKLYELKIDYQLEDKSISFKKLNAYDKFVDLGKKKYNKSIQYNNILTKLDGVSEEKLDRILVCIESILDE